MQNNKIKILITTGIYPPEIGGPATYTALLEEGMPKHNIDVLVLPFRIVRFLPKIIRHFVFFCKVLSFGRRADLLYAQDPVSVGFPTMLAAKILGKPFLARIAGDYAWEQATQRFGVRENIDEFQNKKYEWRVELIRAIQKITVKSADKVITPSKYFRNLVANWNPQKDNVTTIYNGINFSDISNNNNKFKPKTLISAGRLVPWKGFDFLIEMMKNLPDWKLFIAGDGPDKAKLSKLTEDLGLSNKVFILGKMDRKDLIDKMQEYEIFILNTSFESFSFQIVEAMFAGVPVVSTNIGNISEIIDNEENGLLVEPNNKKEILEAIQKLSDISLRTKIITNAKEKAKLFSIEKTITKTAEVIDSLTQNRKQSIFQNNIFLRYFICGITATAVNLFSLYIFTDKVGIWYLYSSVLAFFASLIISFVLQKFVVFKDKKTTKIHHQFSKFFVIAILGVITNTFLIFVCVEYFGIWYILSQMIAGFFVMIQNFILYKFFIFNK
ncbi:MAG: glycosyltransferase [Nanoarchaeota archaeon]|nr:glycosyltransferase [Nanoarchaeota archaeon]